MIDDITCMTDMCVRPVWARGYCGKHYQRWRKYGDPMFTKLPMKIDGTPEERFWAKVDAEGDCWEWLAGKVPQGYGAFHVGGKLVRAHRFSWETLVGPVSEGLELDHWCRNRACVNPDHLEPVTGRVNVMRGYGPAGRNSRKTHCKNNHEFTEENTAKRPGGGRRCKECSRASRDKYTKNTELTDNYRASSSETVWYACASEAGPS